MRAILLWGLILLIFVTVPSPPVAAQGCDDCRELKQELRGATPGPATPATVLEPPAPVVRAVLYWAEGCGHCHEVLDGILPQMQQKYGPQLEVRLVEVITVEDITAFFDVAEAYGFARGHAAVPFLLIGERALMGVDQIAAKLPGIIETHLAAGGTDWPVRAVQAAAGQTAVPADDTCGFTVPCVDEPAATGQAIPTETEAGGTRLPGALAATLGLAAAIGVGVIGALRLRAARRRPTE